MKRLYRITALALVMLLCLSVFAVNAFAAEPQSTVLSARVMINGPRPIPAEQFPVVLKSLDSSNPMPIGSQDGIYKLVFTGDGKKDFPAIEFTTVGIYKYMIYQEPGKMMNAKYDSTVYSVTVYVLNSEKVEDVMTITVVLKNETTGEKVNEVVFKNAYYEHPKTGDNSNIALYAALCGLSAVAVVTVVVVGRKRKNEN